MVTNTLFSNFIIAINCQVYVVMEESCTNVLLQNNERDRLIIFIKKHKSIVQELVYYKLENKTVHVCFLTRSFNCKSIKTLSKNSELKESISFNYIFPISFQ